MADKKEKIQQALEALNEIGLELIYLGCTNQKINDCLKVVEEALNRGAIFEEGFKIKMALAPYKFEKIKKALLLADNDAAKND